MTSYFMQQAPCCVPTACQANYRQFFIDSKHTENVELFVHLGHIVTAQQSDDDIYK